MFINSDRTGQLNDFANLVDNALDNYSQQQFEAIVDALNDLITNLNLQE